MKYYVRDNSVMQYLLLFIFSLLLLQAEEPIPKHNLKCNMLHIYDEHAEDVDNIVDMFSEGEFYSRLRMNSFGLKWNDEVSTNEGIGIRKNSLIGAIGGSLNYKSASFNGLSFSAGLYTTYAKGNLEQDESYLYRGGKDAFSRYDVLTKGKQSITVLAEGYLDYTYEHTNVKLGRQIFESFLTKSNDTKMIPNTFEGISIESRLFNNTSLDFAYFTKQKLRDHAHFHHVLAYGDESSDPYAFYKENDDSAMHIGLVKSKLDARGIEDRLIVVEANNRSIENLVLRANYTAVPKLVSSAMIQADYLISLDKWSVIPGIRYMKQFDDGAGVIGGANLKTLTQNYTNPNSVDAALYAARVDFVQEGLKVRFAYSSIADKGDIIAPWRGFPTGGFTRAMAQYNWNANTKSAMMQLEYDFERIENFKLISRYAIQDYDDEKIGVQADSNVFTLDMIKVLHNKQVYLKTRYAHVMGKDNIVTSSGFRKLDPSNNELRIEVNYLF